MDLVCYREKLREAIWLLALLSEHAATSESRWLVVAEGQGVSDAALAAHLEVSEATARRWRLKLEAEGFLRSTRVGRRLYRLELLNWTASPSESAGERQSVPLVN